MCLTILTSRKSWYIWFTYGVIGMWNRARIFSIGVIESYTWINTCLWNALKVPIMTGCCFSLRATKNQRPMCLCKKCRCFPVLAWMGHDWVHDMCPINPYCSHLNLLCDNLDIELELDQFWYYDFLRHQ